MSQEQPRPAQRIKPDRWFDPAKKLFPHQVGFTAPPHDFDAAPHDFMKTAPEGVGVHGRLLHVTEYEHALDQRVDNFHLLEDFVHCMANAGADVCGQVGTNWSHAGGRTPEDTRAFCSEMTEKYETPLHMAGLCLVDGLRELGAEKIAVNAVYYWPDWRDGITRFLRDAGFDVLYSGNFVDHGMIATDEEMNEATWIFPGDFAKCSMEIAAERAGQADVVVVTGMPNFRRADGLPQRTVTLALDIEEELGLPIVSSDFALYWKIFQTLGVAPTGRQCQLLSTLQS